MAVLRELNTCHNPAGSGIGGQFCASQNSGAEHVVGLTSERPAGDDPAHHRPRKVVADEMQNFAAGLRGLPGVSHVNVTPALGQWNGGDEFSWAVSYDGNGLARRLAAKVGQTWNQDAVLMLHKSESAQHDLVWELEFPSVPLQARRAIAPVFGKVLGGWTWFKRGGNTVLRAASVPEWGGSNAKQLAALRIVRSAMTKAGYTPIGGRSAGRLYRNYRAEVLSRDGAHSYQHVIQGHA